MLRSEAIVQRARWRVAALQLKLNFLRFSLALRAYNPQQPRVPAGSPDGGQWTDEGRGSSNAGQDDGRIIRVSNEEARRYSVILSEEEARGGHTIREHVGKTDQEMLERVLASRRNSLFHAYGRRRVGSFESIESANNYINRTLELSQSEVNQVASGKEDSAFIVQRFGYRTGREAYTDGYKLPHMRTTYGVGVFIYHDPGSARGYRVHSAYPRNDEE